MESYDKHGKKQSGRYPMNQRQIWNDKAGDEILSDVLGSYSGADIEEEEPVQDVDDL